MKNKIEVSPISTMRLMTLNDAVMYCLFLEVDGKRDWRLPNMNELHLLVNSVADHKEKGFAHWTQSDKPEIYANSSVKYWVRAVREKKVIK
jgi:hypothetical protein